MKEDQALTAMAQALRQADAPVAGQLANDYQVVLGQMLNVSRLATIGEMAAGIAHELNQPLTAIANYSQACDRLLDQDPIDTGDLHMALGEITREAVRASQIMRRLRNLSRINEMSRAPTDVNAMIHEVVALAGVDARAHDIRLAMSLDGNLPLVELDYIQIQHVLLNLIRNATDALLQVRTGVREIQVRSGLSAGGALELAVCDTGPGLTAEVQRQLFDPFFSTKPGGTGLGLPISHSIVRAHGGTLGYRHNTPQGACFFLHIPLQPVSPQNAT